MTEAIIVKANERRKRAELNLPQMTFHHYDSWRKTIGNDAFMGWQVLYTLADRKKYPGDHIIHGYDYDRLADHFQCGREKAVKIIKILYEYGLVEIQETKNKFGGYINIFIWCDVPFYSETIYCQLDKRRDWKDRQTEGQKVANRLTVARMKIRRALNNSQYENHTGSSYEKQTDSPYGNRTVVINTNNNISNKTTTDPEELTKGAKKRSVVVDRASPARSKNLPPPLVNEGAIEICWQAVVEAAGVDLPRKFIAGKLIQYADRGGVNYFLKKVELLTNQRKTVENVEGWLKDALANDWQPGHQARTRAPVQHPDAKKDKRKKALVNSLYFRECRGGNKNAGETSITDNS